MTDIKSVDTVEAGGYTVRVGRSEEEAGWDAVVLSEGGSGSGAGLPSGLTMSSTRMGMVMEPAGSGEGEEGADEPDSPVVTAPHKWVAVGFAIEAHEWDGARETEAVGDAYGMAGRSVDGAFPGGPGPEPVEIDDPLMDLLLARPPQHSDPRTEDLADALRLSFGPGTKDWPLDGGDEGGDR